MRLKRMLFICAVSLFLIGLTCLQARAQQITGGTVAGTVTDNSGAAVAGAQVTLTDLATNAPRTATTNAQGHYIFNNVPPSTYSLQVTKQGFNAAAVPSLTVQVGSVATQDITLKVGAVNTTVTVSESSASQLQTMNSTIGNTVSGTALDALPALGRDAATFVTLQPGVSPDGSVAGAVVDQSTFMLDGGNNTDDMSGSNTVYTPSTGSDPTGGVAAGGGLQGGMNSGGVPTGAVPTPIDSVQQFKVNTANQTADFNSSSGAQVEMVTRRGTNQWHGSLYDYYLDNNWNANTWDNNNTGTPLPSYHYNRFGGRIGGAIIPKTILGGKTYAFFMYEGFRWPNSQTYEAVVPSAAMRAGILTFNGTAYPVAAFDPRGIGINPVVQAMWNKYEPVGNDPACTDIPSASKCDGVNTLGFIGNLAVPQSSNFGVTRIDHDFGSKWHFNATYHYYRIDRTTTQQVDVGGFFPGDTLGVPKALSHRPQAPSLFTAGVTTNLSSNTTNEFHYSYERNYWQWEDPGAPPQIAGTSAALEPFGEWAGTNNQSLTPFNVNAQNIRTRFWDGHDNMFRDDVSTLRGNHLIQFGGTYQHNWDYHQRTDNGGGINYTPTYQLGDSKGAGTVNMSAIYGAGFNGGVESVATDRMLAAELGIVTEAQTVFTRTGPNLTLNPPLTPAFDKQTIPFYNFYASDTWHMKPSFTLTYGLGWTLELPPVEAAGKSVDAVDASGQQLDLQAYLAERKNAALRGQVFNPPVGFALVGNTGSGHEYPYDPYYGSFSPRVSFAWNPTISGGMFGRMLGTNNTVIRAGYGRIYGRLNGVDLVLVPLLGVGPMQAVQCTQVLASGACGPATPTASTAFRVGIDGASAPFSPVPVSQTLPQPDFPGINSVPSAAPSVFDPHFRPNSVDSVDFTIQRSFGPKVIMEVGYVGRYIHHEYQPYNINAVPYMMTLGGQSFAQAYAAVESAMGCTTSFVACGANPTPAVAPQPFFENALAGTGYCTPGTCTATVVANEFSNLATQSVWSLWSDLDQGGIGGGPGGTTNPGFNFPRSMMNTPLNTPFGANGQLSSGVALNASEGYGNYNGAFVSLKTNDWHGLTTQQNFTWSKALGTGAFVQASSEYTPNDPFNLGAMYGRQAFDYEKVYNLFIVYAPPIDKGGHGFRGHLLGGWSFAPIFAAGSGAPLYCNTQTDGQAFGEGDGVNFFSNEQCIFSQNPGTPTIHITHNPDGTESANYFTDPTAIANAARPPILGLDRRDNGVGIVSNVPYWNADLQIKKVTKITERFQLETQFLFLNVFNHDQLGNAGNTDPFDLTQPPDQWGNAGSQSNTPRQMEFGLRLNF